MKNNIKILKDEKENLLPPINNGMNHGDTSRSPSEFSKNCQMNIHKISNEKNDIGNIMIENIDEINLDNRNGSSVEKKINRKTLRDNSDVDSKQTYFEIRDRVKKILKAI